MIYYSEIRRAYSTTYHNFFKRDGVPFHKESAKNCACVANIKMTAKNLNPAILFFTKPSGVKLYN